MTTVNMAPRRMRMRMRCSVRLSLGWARLVCAAGLCAALSARGWAQYAGAAPQHEPTPTVGATATSEVVTQLLAAKRPALTLDPGDEIQIEVFEIDKYQYKTRVNTDGTVSMPLINSISLEGLTAEQAELAIEHRLQNEGMVNEPHVHVTVLEKPSQLITVAGAVEKPGTYPAFGARTLLSLISDASGMTETASRTVTLIRPGAAAPFVLNLGADPAKSPVGQIPVFAGDTIAVGTVGVFYVVGAVKLSGVYKLKTETPTSAVQGVTMAGGAGFEAIANKAEIVRTVDGRRTEIPFDYKAALNHVGPDPVLMADDIVFLPTDNMRAALKGGGLGIAVALASAFLYHY